MIMIIVFVIWNLIFAVRADCVTFLFIFINEVYNDERFTHIQQMIIFEFTGTVKADERAKTDTKISN